MLDPPRIELPSVSEKMRILDLEEQILAQDFRIASLDGRLRREDRPSDARLRRHEEATQALKDALTRINEENTVRLREQAGLTSQVAALESFQAEQAPLFADCGVLKGQQLRLDSVIARTAPVAAPNSAVWWRDGFCSKRLDSKSCFQSSHRILSMRNDHIDRLTN
jgi:hypothetical protein